MEVGHMLAGENTFHSQCTVRPKRISLVVGMAVVLMIALLSTHVAQAQITAAPERKTGSLTSELLNVQDLLEPMYFDVLPHWLEEGLEEAEDFHLTIDPWDYVDWGYDPELANEPTWEVVTGLGGRDVQALLWEEEESWLAWEFEVPESGLYNLMFDYYPLEGKRATIQRDIKVNGEYPFNEAKRIIFYRTWRDAAAPTQDNQGNDTRPGQEEVHVWRTSYF